MPTEMTIEAAIIELNRLKSQERMDIDRERLNAAIDKLTGAGRFRIARKPDHNNFTGANYCPGCGEYVVQLYESYCGFCGQALDWN